MGCRKPETNSDWSVSRDALQPGDGDKCMIPRSAQYCTLPTTLTPGGSSSYLQPYTKCILPHSKFPLKSVHFCKLHKAAILAEHRIRSNNLHAVKGWLIGSFLQKRIQYFIITRNMHCSCVIFMKIRLVVQTRKNVSRICGNALMLHVTAT